MAVISALARSSFQITIRCSKTLAANIGETISQQVFNDILQMLYEEKLLTQRETQLLLATTSDEVLGRDALILRASMLKKIIQQVDRKGNTD